MRRKSIAVLLLTGLLGGVAAVAPLPHAAAQMNDQPMIVVGPTVQGEVTQKFTDDRDNTMIAVNGQPYQVPFNFYNHVDVGTVVQFDGTHWTIISGGI